MIIAGAGGHALEVFDVLLEMGYARKSILFYDDFTDRIELTGCKIIKSTSELSRYLTEVNSEFCLGVGKPELRKKFYDLFDTLGGVHVPLLSPRAFVSKSCANKGADIMAFVFISAKSELGKGCLINTRSNIHHEVKIGEFTEIAPSCNILGMVKVGNFCSLGANTSIIPKKNITNFVVSAAGAVIINDINKSALVYGVPAKEK